MPISSSLFGSPQQVLATRPKQAALASNQQNLKFQGLVDPIVYALDILGKNKILELTLVDASTMIGPRTIQDYRNRGGEMARETLLRESSGAFNHMLLCGFLSLPAVALLNYLTLPYLFKHGGQLLNAHGINQRAWINNNTLEEFSNTFNRQLKEAVRRGWDAQTLRTNFIRNILSRMQGTDGFSVANTFGKLFKAEQLNENKLARATLSRRPEDIEPLVKLFAQSPSMHQGVYRLEEHVADYCRKVGETEQYLGNPFSPKRLDQIANRKRIQLTDRMLTDQKEFLKFAREKFVLAGLSSDINILDDETGKPIKHLSGKDLKVKLKELKYFLEQYIDRALAGTTDRKLGTGKLTDSMAVEIEEKLIRQGKNIFPGAKDGLVTFTRKSHTLFTGLLLFLSIGITGSIAFVNNLITQNRNHGQVFFPGMKGLADKTVEDMAESDEGAS